MIKVHPYGHARIAIAATVGLAILLFVVAVGIVMGAAERLFDPESLLIPGWIALSAAGLAILANQGLFQYIMRVGEFLRSTLPRFAGEIGVCTVHPRYGRWQLSQFMVPLAEMRLSKNSVRPGSMHARVGLLSGLASTGGQGADLGHVATVLGGQGCRGNDSVRGDQCGHHCLTPSDFPVLNQLMVECSQSFKLRAYSDYGNLND